MTIEDAIEPWADLEAQQAMLEREAAEWALKTSSDGRNGRSGAMVILRRHLAPLERAIAGFTDTAMEAPEPRRPTAARLLAEFGDPAAAAYLTLRLALESSAGVGALTALAAKLGARIDEERRMRRLRRVERRLFDQLMRRARPHRSYRERRKRLLKAADRVAADAQTWPLRDRALLGVKLLELAVERTGLFEIGLATTRLGGRIVSRRVVEPSAKLAAALKSAAHRAALLRVERDPMVRPPEPWTGLRGGGYLTAQAPLLSLVKTRSLVHLAELESMAAPQVYRAVNAAQETAWRVNRRVLSVQRRCLDEKRALGGLPILEAAPPPEQPQDGAGEAVLRSHRRAMRLWREEERRRRSRALALRLTHQTARRFSRFERIWLPHQLDFRGRLYPATRLSPQGPDPVRALLEFSEGRPLGEEGWKWLAIHLANCGDFEKISKAPLAERVRWVFRNEERIRAVAADPMADLFWCEADKPWQFLAACLEWDAYVQRIERCGEAAANAQFRSHLPVALDGACSGLQHFSLMLRDEIGGAAVNLAPKADASDLYTDVAQRLRRRLESDLDSERSIRVGGARVEARVLARAWLDFGVDRGLVKRPTMTYSYGARSFGYADQIIEDALEPRRAAAREGEADWPFPGDDVVGPAVYLATHIAEAIEGVVVKAAEAMNWLQGLAAESAKRDLPLRWTTPDGFIVLQAYRETRRRMIHTTLSGRVLRLTMREESERIDRRRQRQGAAPNVIHSLDACHLRLTVAKAHREGLRSFALVHDSFGVHAADTPRFFQMIREALVELYGETDVPERLNRELAAGLPPGARRAHAPPAQGDLALDQVLEAEFAFA